MSVWNLTARIYRITSYNVCYTKLLRAVGASALPQFTHPEKAVYVFGPEDGSLPQEVVDKAHHVVYVPTVGCMNLAATVNVVLYDRLAKTLGSIDDHQQVIANRDNKNRLKVRDGV